MIDHNAIRVIFMKHGFTIKEGQTDLKPYVYAAADELIALARATPQHPEAPADDGAGSYSHADIVRAHTQGYELGLRQKASAISAVDAATPQHSVTEQAAAWANWKVGTDSYVPFKTREQAEASMRRSDIAATQEGPYEVIPLFHQKAARAQPLASTAATQPEQADDIRAAGWAVAVHNDYRLNGEAHTFWLFTKDGRAVKGEGKTDAEALAQVRAALAIPASLDPRFIADLAHSREKYPSTARMFDGLMGEVDELRRAYGGDGDRTAEAFDVAVVAYRIATEGDDGGNVSLASTAASKQRNICVICKGALGGCTDCQGTGYAAREQQASVSELPPLPEPFGTMENADEEGHTIGWVHGYTAVQMRGYAIDALSGRATIPSEADERARAAFQKWRDDVGDQDGECAWITAWKVVLTATQVAIDGLLRYGLDSDRCIVDKPDGAFVFLSDVKRMLATTAADQQGNPEPDMIWWEDDPEMVANSPDEFAKDYASNCLRTGEDVVVRVDCATRSSNRAMHITVVEGDDDAVVMWKWVDRTATVSK